MTRSSGVQSQFVPPPWVPRLTPRDPLGHKGTSGRVVIVGGSTGLTGAVDLAQGSALRVGAGLVTCAIPADTNSILEIKTTEAMTFPLPDDGWGRLGEASLPALLDLYRKADAIVLGPGLGRTAETRAFVHAFLDLHKREPVPLVIDADGLFHLARLAPSGWSAAKTVLTPHPGELRRLAAAAGHSGDDHTELESDWPRISAAFPATWVLKGPNVFATDAPENWVIDPAGSRTRCRTGNPGLATGGSGDLLAGAIGGWLAQGFSAGEAARLGVWVQGRAADLAAYGEQSLSTGSGRPPGWPGTFTGEFGNSVRGERGLLPCDVRDALPRAVLELEAYDAQRFPPSNPSSGADREPDQGDPRNEVPGAREP